jgi:hypothetical protein
MMTMPVMDDDDESLHDTLEFTSGSGQRTLRVLSICPAKKKGVIRKKERARR